MQNKLIETLFHTKDYQLNKLDKGLTNHNYLLIVNQKKYVVRIPQVDSEHMISRTHEKEVSKLVTNLDSEVIYFDEISGIKITKFIENVYEYDLCPFYDKIERCAKLMKKLHHLDKVDFHFNPIETLHNYEAHVNKPLYDLTPYLYVIEEIKKCKQEEVLCHNDFVSGNILYTETRDYLIDYEYAAMNNPLFDVISFLSENQIFNKEDRDRFYQTYFENQEIPYHELWIWEMFENVLWCTWAMMMYESRHESIYQSIAYDKYHAIQQMEKTNNEK